MADKPLGFGICNLQCLLLEGDPSVSLLFQAEGPTVLEGEPHRLVLEQLRDGEAVVRLDEGQVVEGDAGVGERALPGGGAAFELEAITRLADDTYPGIPTARIQVAASKVEQKIPLGRLGRPEDIAPFITFLATDDASYATGANFVIDGGFTMS